MNAREAADLSPEEQAAAATAVDEIDDDNYVSVPPMSVTHYMMVPLALYDAEKAEMKRLRALLTKVHEEAGDRLDAIHTPLVETTGPFHEALAGLIVIEEATCLFEADEA